MGNASFQILFIHMHLICGVLWTVALVCNGGVLGTATYSVTVAACPRASESPFSFWGTDLLLGLLWCISLGVIKSCCLQGYLLWYYCCLQTLFPVLDAGRVILESGEKYWVLNVYVEAFSVALHTCSFPWTATWVSKHAGIPALGAQWDKMLAHDIHASLLTSRQHCMQLEFISTAWCGPLESPGGGSSVFPSIEVTAEFPQRLPCALNSPHFLIAAGFLPSGTELRAINRKYREKLPLCSAKLENQSTEGQGISWLLG